MQKVLTTELLNRLSDKYGDAFYLLDTDVFEANYNALSDTFKNYYPKFNIAYSYKTNYTPRIVQIIDRMGGYAEIVSEMELDIALRSGVSPNRIIWNGPIKNEERVTELLLQGGIVNLDSIYEIAHLHGIAESHPDQTLNVGVRLNYDVGDGTISRFGFDVEGEEFKYVMSFLSSAENINLVNLQAHFAKRSPEYWTARADGILGIYDRIVNEYGMSPKWLDLGGGIFGEMPCSLRSQLGIAHIQFDDYASKAAKLFADRFGNAEDSPILVIEPGTALAGNCMRFVSKVKTIKKVREKTFVTVMGSQKNISMSGINPPMEIVSGGGNKSTVLNADIAGYTCIEGDILQKGFTGEIGIGDYVVIGNCGSYSLVMKPPFILPNFPVIELAGDESKVIKRAETFEDLFHTFSFDQVKSFE